MTLSKTGQGPYLVTVSWKLDRTHTLRIRFILQEESLVSLRRVLPIIIHLLNVIINACIGTYEANCMKPSTALLLCFGVSEFTSIWSHSQIKFFQIDFISAEEKPLNQ